MATNLERDALPYVKYGRTSRLNGRDAADNLSRGEQFAAIPEIGRRYGLPLLDEEFYDADASGSTFERPQWERAVQGVRDGRYAGIVAFNFKRISRGKVAEVLAMVEDVESVGGRLYDQTGPVSVDDADAELMTTVQAMIARREWRERRAYLLSNVESAIARGVHLSVPYGYQRLVKGTPLQVNRPEAEQVRRMFELRADGATWPAIATALNASGAQPRPYTRHGERLQARWTHKTVRQIVDNRVYAGIAWNGEHEKLEAHPAIVEPELYQRANRTRGTKPQGPEDGYLLTGLVRCHNCGYAMVNSTHSGRRYLRCLPKQNGGCGHPANVPAEQLEDYVVRQFAAQYLTGGSAPTSDSGVTDAAAALELATGQLRLAKRERRELEGTGASALEVEIADEDVDEATAKLRAAEAVLLEARNAERGADLPAELTDLDVFLKLPMVQQRHWLSAVYAAVVVRAARRWREPAADRAGLIALERPRLVGAALRRRATALPM